MIKCPSCQAENSDGAKACFLCGQRLKKPGLLKRMFGGGGSKPASPEAGLGHEVDLSLPEASDTLGQPPSPRTGAGSLPGTRARRSPRRRSSALPAPGP